MPAWLAFRGVLTTGVLIHTEDVGRPSSSAVVILAKTTFAKKIQLFHKKVQVSALVASSF
ncbi:MAG: hypothetical protein AAGJ10_10070 [Bacteroidota bacterium]